MAAAVPAFASPASSLPKIQAGIGPPSNWHHTWRVRPGYVYFGAGAGYAAPRMKSLHWFSYGQAGAGATGYWWNDNCRPSCAQGGHWVAAHAHFYDMFFHAGAGRNFANVSVAWRGGHWGAYIDSAGQWNWPS